MLKNTGFGAALMLALAMAGGPISAQDTPAPGTEEPTEPGAPPQEPVAEQAPAVPAGPPPTAETVVATVNGKDITLGHMLVLRGGLPEQYQQLPDDVLFAGILDQLIQQTALADSVEDTLSLTDQLTLQNEERGFLSGVALRAVVANAVTDAAIQEAYDARYKDMAPPTEYNASHILVDSEEKARELKTQLEGGADFAALAKENSTDTGSGANGGSLGWFGLGMMVKPFEDAVVTLEPGQISEPVQTQFGWHIVKLIETREGQIPSIDDVREDIAAEIERKVLEDHIAQITESATVTRPGEGIDPAALRDLTLLGE